DHGLGLSPDGLTFAQPVSITFPYTDAELNGAAPASLGIWVVDNGSWQLVGGSVDTLARTLTVTVTHFTTYAPMAPSVPPTDTPTATETPIVPCLPLVCSPTPTPTDTSTPTSTSTPTDTPTSTDTPTNT